MRKTSSPDTPSPLSMGSFSEGSYKMNHQLGAQKIQGDRSCQGVSDTLPSGSTEQMGELQSAPSVYFSYPQSLRTLPFLVVFPAAPRSPRALSLTGLLGRRG